MNISLVSVEDPVRFLNVLQLASETGPALGHHGYGFEQSLDFLADSRFRFLESLVAAVPPPVAAVLEAFVKAQALLFPRQLHNGLSRVKRVSR